RVRIVRAALHGVTYSIEYLLLSLATGSSLTVQFSLSVLPLPSAAEPARTHQFVTMSCLPTGLVASLGGTAVAAKVRETPVSQPRMHQRRARPWWSEIYARDVDSRPNARGFWLLDHSHQPPSSCRALHVLYSQSSPPFPPLRRLRRAASRTSLLATSDTLGRTGHLRTTGTHSGQSLAPQRDAKGEANAREVSDRLPFIEYELHNSQLVQKLRLRGMNGLFGLRTRMSVASCGNSGDGHRHRGPPAGVAAPCEPQLVSKGDQRLLSSLQAKVSEFVSRRLARKEVEEVKMDAVLLHELDRVRGALALIGPKRSQPSQPHQRISSNASASNSDSGGRLRMLRLPRPSICSQISETTSSSPWLTTAKLTRWKPLLVDYPLMDSELLLADMLHSTCFHFRHSLPCTLASSALPHGGHGRELLQTVLTGDCVRQTAPQGGLLLGNSQRGLLCSGCHRAAGPWPTTWAIWTFSSSARPAPPFLHTCLAEVMAVVRAHAAALGGQAVTSFHLSEVLLLDNPSRGHAQCLLNVCGDVVQL
uniref:Protein kinase domain-containing protein n=1 Tax=Macrostomum lignano TaxID=282301 RepID=A0A1I8JPX5_9PLAT